MSKLRLLFILVIFISACKPAQKQDLIHEEIAAHCIASQSECLFNTELGNFRIKFAQHQLADKIKTELPFTIELEVIPLNSEFQPKFTKISSYLEGKDMFMGKVPIFFKANEDKHVYKAESLLANCTEEQMVWRLWLTLETDNKAQNLFVDFTSVRL